MKIMSIVAAFTVAAVSLPVRAADDIDIAKVLKDLRTSTASARVVITDPGVLYVATLTEPQMNKYGCAYPVTDAGELQVVFDLLERGRIENTTPFFRFGPEPRMGIYLQGKDGSTHKLLFTGTGYRPKPEYGTYNGTVSIQAKNPEFAPELRAWAVTREPERGTRCNPETFLPKNAPGAQ